MSAAREIAFALLAVPQSTASALYGMHDLLLSAGCDGPKARPTIVSRDGRRVRSATGPWIEPERAVDACARPDVVVVPDLRLASASDVESLSAETAWLRACYAAGAVVAASGSGALLLAEAGLLDGQDATTHWNWCDAMARRYPAVRVHANRALVVAGEEQRLILGGAGTGWHDLTLFLVARLFGAEEAVKVARLHLLDWHANGPQALAAIARPRQIEDAAIARCQEWVAQHYDSDSPVAGMVRLSGLSESAFKRRFMRATGMSPIQYVHTLRLAESKHMLETTRLPIDVVAAEVGYEDASFFSRLFRREVGLTPAQYRRRFGAPPGERFDHLSPRKPLMPLAGRA